ncbi:hypothetical protein [Streptomonospora litoralis]|uniref:hypothetical protein n=1 Tax=Streptomonospora litoralis TaxID=2498135 RepID=UPI0010362ABF|nr:hypothetical protein [Streptomonospora litoralis]
MSAPPSEEVDISEARTTAPVVCFLHPLANGRVWWRLTEALPRRIRTLVVEQPLTGRIQPPGLTRDVVEAARAALSRTGVDLVVAPDLAAHAGAELVADGSAAHALLINPDTTALVDQPGYQTPALTSDIGSFLLDMAPYHEQMREQATVPAEGVETMVEFSLRSCAHLDEQDRDLLHDISVEHMTRSIPFDIPAEGVAAPPEHTWFTRLSADPERFTVYCGEIGPLSEHIRTVVPRNVPQARMVRASPTTGYPWLEQPQALAALIDDLVTRGAPESADVPHT